MERHLLKTIHNTLDVETDYLNARENFYAAANTVLEKSATYAASLKSLLEDLLKAERPKSMKWKSNGWNIILRSLTEADTL